jgi:hypothetical protein
VTGPLLEWLKRLGPVARPAPTGPIEAPPAPRRLPSGALQLLYQYLEGRYADTVVLTFADIEDLLGIALPAQARSQPQWWTDSWILTSRTAKPNLLAQTVSFERAS